MSFGQPTTTIIGNIASDHVELRYTPGGRAVAKFRVAVGKRVKDQAANQYKDGPASFWTVLAWAELGENAAASLTKGDRVVVSGTVEIREYTIQAGENAGQRRTSTEITAEAVGADLRYASVKIQKMARASQGNAPAGGSDADEWATAGPVDQ